MADWSSIWAGFGIMWGGLAAYGLSLLIRSGRFRKADGTSTRPDVSDRS